MSKNTLKKYATSAAIAIATAAPAIASAQGLGGDAPAAAEDTFGMNYATGIGLGTKDVRETVAGVIRGFMGLLGIVAVVIILLGGFKWMTAAGSEEKVAEAKKLIISGIIGLVIILSAYGIATFVVGAIVNGTQG